MLLGNYHSEVSIRHVGAFYWKEHNLYLLTPTTAHTPLSRSCTFIHTPVDPQWPLLVLNPEVFLHFLPTSATTTSSEGTEQTPHQHHERPYSILVHDLKSGGNRYHCFSPSVPSSTTTTTTDGESESETDSMVWLQNREVRGMNVRDVVGKAERRRRFVLHHYEQPQQEEAEEEEEEGEMASTSVKSAVGCEWGVLLEEEETEGEEEEAEAGEESAAAKKKKKKKAEEEVYGIVDFRVGSMEEDPADDHTEVDHRGVPKRLTLKKLNDYAYTWETTFMKPQPHNRKPKEIKILHLLLLFADTDDGRLTGEAVVVEMPKSNCHHDEHVDRVGTGTSRGMLLSLRQNPKLKNLYKIVKQRFQEQQLGVASEIEDTMIVPTLEVDPALRPPLPLLMAQSETPLSFLVTSDVHLKENMILQPYFDPIIANVIPTDQAVFLAGDNVDSGTETNYDLLHSLLYQTAGRLKPLPLFVGIGNHDCHKNGWENWRKHFGRSFGWTTIGGPGDCLVVFLDSAAGVFGQDQLGWFDRLLTAQRSDFTIVVVITHYSFTFESPKQPDLLFQDPEEIRERPKDAPKGGPLRIYELFKKHTVDLAISGHTHYALLGTRYEIGTRFLTNGYYKGRKEAIRVNLIPTEMTIRVVVDFIRLNNDPRFTDLYEQYSFRKSRW